MLKLYPFLILFLIVSCGDNNALDISEEEIDQYIETKIDTSQVYDITQGLRFSKDDETYQVTEYMQNDSVILHNSQEIKEFSTVMMNIFYKDGMPVYIEEFNYQYSPESTEVVERKIYMNGVDVIKSYERKAEYETAIDDLEYVEADVQIESYDLDRPKRAIKQEQEFEMKFGEFLIINPESYLILENEESGYGVALYIMEGDMLLDELFEKPEQYRGKTIEVFHEFMNMNGIERMIYRGGIVKD